jgi:hypothetical protein
MLPGRCAAALLLLVSLVTLDVARSGIVACTTASAAMTGGEHGGHAQGGHEHGGRGHEHRSPTRHHGESGPRCDVPCAPVSCASGTSCTAGATIATVAEAPLLLSSTRLGAESAGVPPSVIAAPEPPPPRA